jgi:tetratricopeptide (TPR) repeat protein
MSEQDKAQSTNEQADAKQSAPNTEPKNFSVDLSQGLEEAFNKVRERAQHYLKRGQYTQVRLKFRGRELVTLPLSMLVAVEAATLLTGLGPLRWLIVNAIGRTFLDVEFINEADTVVAQGKQRLLDGELDEALAHFRQALTMDADNASAHLNLGVALKLKGERDEALAAFEKAVALDPSGDTGKEARRQLEKLRPKAS